MGEPLSRVEAILQNILGADNILVPPGSQVEEILQAIYYNTEYENNPKSRVAEILLAIKNKGVYDGPVLSRVEDILVHKLNGIPYTKHKKEDLSRVEQLLLDWLEQGGGEEIIEYTGTFPMTILANGEPLIDYLISGNTVQSGTPTPDSPVMPQGTGERTGNLFDIMPFSAKWATVFSILVTFLNQLAAGNYTLSYDIELTQRNNVSDNSTYGIAIIGAITQNTLRWDTAEVGTIRRVSHSFTISTSMAGNIERAFAYGCGINGVGATGEARISNIMLNTGSTPLPYEPYGYKIPISSANTTTPVYLGEVETTRKIKKLVLTGEENVYLQSINAYGIANFYIYIGTNNLNAICTHLKRQSTIISQTTDEGYLISLPAQVGQNASFYIRIKSETASTVAELKAYLAAQYAAGTPVTIWYVLANEETGIANEPLQKIGNYTDTLSKEQAGEDVPTNEKPIETVIDVPTSVKPSEGYIKYTEPTDGPAPKTQVLGTKNHEIYMTSNDEVYILRR